MTGMREDAAIVMAAEAAIQTGLEVGSGLAGGPES
jgi:hypothetical protein